MVSEQNSVTIIIGITIKIIQHYKIEYQAIYACKIIELEY